MYQLIIKNSAEGEPYVTMPEFDTYSRAIEVAQNLFFCFSKGISIDLLHPAEEGDSRRKFETLKRKDYSY